MKKHKPQKKLETVIKFQFPNHTGLTGSPDINGAYIFKNSEGLIIDPIKMTFETFYNGKNKRKFRIVMNTNKPMSLNLYAELSKLHSFFAIDTNTQTINGQRLSISCAIRWKILKVNDGFIAQTLERVVHVLEFRNVPSSENPEMLAILMVANHIIRTENLTLDSTIGFVNDYDMNAHSNISLRKSPIYKEHFLPAGFDLIYASDHGNNLLNQLVRICDKQSSKVIRLAKLGLFENKNISICSFDNEVLFLSDSMPLEPYTTGKL